MSDENKTLENKTPEQQEQDRRVVAATFALQSLHEQIEAAETELETATQERDWGATGAFGKSYAQSRYDHIGE